MNDYLRLALTALIPILVSLLLYWISRHVFYEKLSYVLKQLIAGIVFGAVAVSATEFGVTISGATMNCRDAAPICAALLFGGPAGIIAGLIGGIERWYAVYWGAGQYTRLACTIGTIFSGFYGAMLKKHIFDNNIPRLDHAFASGFVCEIVHMLMIFVTNPDDMHKAFSVVKICTLPMTLTTAFAVMFAIMLVNLIKDKKTNDENDRPLLSEIFQKNLLIVMLVAYLFTCVVSYVLQNHIAITDINNILKANLQDVKNDISTTSDNNLLKITQIIADYLDQQSALSNEMLVYLAETNGVSEISYVDYHGFICYSTNSSYIGFDMRTGGQSKAFMILLEDDDTVQFVQKLMPISYDSSISYKYAGICLKRGGFVQVGYDVQHFQEDITSELSIIANNRHVGESGSIVIIDENMKIVSAADSSFYGYEIPKENADALVNQESNVVYKGNVNGTEYYYMLEQVEGYYIIILYPASEADFARDVSLYLNTFMEVIVFAGLFILTYFMVKFLVVKNIIKVDASLNKITEGNLDTIVDVKTTQEFEELSAGINQTVDALKKYIADANARIDAELKYAADIQRSALPSMFHPFPEKADEFDIYALMDPAKEVGGDFYDFYILNKYILAFLVADVSGKGIPASLFMMRAKSIIKSYAEAGFAVNDIFINTNYNLCEGNDAGMFVTAWMGFLDLRTGELVYANAGHNHPVIKRKNGEYEYLIGKPGFVLGGMEDIVFKAQYTTLMPGDEIFLYTDGVPEATNANNELFGDERLRDSLNRHCDLCCRDLCEALHKDVDEFVGEAPQFDDITMLSLRFFKLHEHGHGNKQ